MTKLSAEQVIALKAELAQLHGWQIEATENAAFIPMSKDQWELYESRLSRIREITERLGRP